MQVESEGLLQITRLCDALREIRKSMQEKHLACCIFPRFHGSREIAGAMHELSIKKIGALIALEQEMSLDDYIRSGVLNRTNCQPALSLKTRRKMMDANELRTM